MQIEKRTMNWLPRQSLYDEQVAARAKQRANHDEFLTSQSSFMDSIGSILSDNTTESGNLVSQVAAARLGVTIDKTS